MPLNINGYRKVGMMNIGFIIDNTFVVTPTLEDTILKGVTCDSVVSHFKRHGN